MDARIAICKYLPSAAKGSKSFRPSHRSGRKRHGRMRALLSTLCERSISKATTRVSPVPFHFPTGRCADWVEKARQAFSLRRTETGLRSATARNIGCSRAKGSFAPTRTISAGMPIAGTAGSFLMEWTSRFSSLALAIEIGWGCLQTGRSFSWSARS